MRDSDRPRGGSPHAASAPLNRGRPRGPGGCFAGREVLASRSRGSLTACYVVRWRDTTLLMHYVLRSILRHDEVPQSSSSVLASSSTPSPRPASNPSRSGW